MFKNGQELNAVIRIHREGQEKAHFRRVGKAWVNVSKETERPYVNESKSAAGRRQLDVPEPVRTYLLKLIGGKRADDYVFPSRPVRGQPPGHADPDWVRDWVKRICRDCGVQVITAHSMRGLHATLAKRAGATSAAVAAQLGHADERVSEQSYIAPEAKAGADQGRVLQVLSGGRK
jgi:integrase